MKIYPVHVFKCQRDVFLLILAIVTSSIQISNNALQCLSIKTYTVHVFKFQRDVSLMISAEVRCCIKFQIKCILIKTYPITVHVFKFQEMYS